MILLIIGGLKMATKQTVDKLIYCLGTLDGIKKCTPEDTPKWLLLDKVTKRLDEVLKEIQC